MLKILNTTTINGEGVQDTSSSNGVNEAGTTTTVTTPKEEQEEVKEDVQAAPELKPWQQKMSDFYAQQRMKVESNSHPAQKATDLGEYTKQLEQESVNAVTAPSQAQQGLQWAKQEQQRQKDIDSMFDAISKSGVYTGTRSDFGKIVGTQEGADVISKYNDWAEQENVKRDKDIEDLYNTLSSNGYYEKDALEQFKKEYNENPEEISSLYKSLYQDKEKERKEQFRQASRKAQGLSNLSAQEGKAGSRREIVSNGKVIGYGTKVNDDPTDNTYRLEQDTPFELGSDYTTTENGQQKTYKAGETVILPKGSEKIFHTKEASDATVARHVESAKPNVDAAMKSGGIKAAQDALAEGIFKGKNHIQASTEEKTLADGTKTSEAEQVMQKAWDEYLNGKVNDAAQEQMDYIDNVLSDPRNMTGAEHFLTTGKTGVELPKDDSARPAGMSAEEYFHSEKEKEEARRSHLYSDLVSQAANNYAENLKKQGVPDDVISQTLEMFKAQMAAHIADYNTNERIAERVIGKGKWESLDASLKDILKTTMDITGGVKESLTGKILLGGDNSDNVGQMINKLTEQMDTMKRSDVNSILRGTMGFIPDLWIYHGLGRIGAAAYTTFMGRVFTFADRMPWAKNIVSGLVEKGMSESDALATYRRAVLQSMKGAGKFGYETARELTQSSSTFALTGFANGVIDDMRKPYMTQEENQFGNEMFFAGSEDPQYGQSLYQLTKAGGSPFDLWYVKENSSDPSLAERIKRHAEAGWDGAFWGGLSGAMFWGSPLTRWIGKSNTLHSMMGSRSTYLMQDAARLAINASGMTAAQLAEQASKMDDGNGFITNIKKAWGENGWKTYWTNVANLGILDAAGVVSRSINAEKLRDAERQAMPSNERTYYEQRYDLPTNAMELLKQVVDGKVALPKGDGKSTRGKTVQIFERKKDENGKVIPLTEEQQKINQALTDLANFTDIPEYVVAPLISTITGEPWKMTIPTQVGEVRMEYGAEMQDPKNQRWAVDLLDDDGHVIDTHFCSSKAKAEDKRNSLDISIGIGDLDAVSAQYINKIANATFGQALAEEYDGLQKRVQRYKKAYEKMQHVGKKGLSKRERKAVEELTQHEQDVILVSENMETYAQAQVKMKAGESLTPEEVKINDAVNRLFLDHMDKSKPLEELIAHYEEIEGMKKGELQSLQKGHETKKDAKDADKKSEGIVKIGDKWYTMGEVHKLRKFRATLNDTVKLIEEKQKEQAEKLADKVEETVTAEPTAEPAAETEPVAEQPATPVEEEQAQESEQPAPLATFAIKAEDHPVFTQAQQSRETGKTLQGDDRRKVSRDYRRLNQSLNDMGVDTEALDQILARDDANALVDFVQGIDDANTKRTVLDYIDKAKQYQGMLDNVMGEIQSRVTARHQEIDSQVGDDGKVTEVTIDVPGEGKKVVYLKTGTLAVNADGTVNHEASDKAVYALDPATGETISIDPKNIVSVTSSDVQELKQRAAVEEAAQVKGEHQAALEGRHAFNNGDVIDVAVKGEKKVARILQNNGDGTVVAEIDGKPTTIRVEDLQQMSDDVDALQQSNIPAESPAVATPQAAAPVQVAEPKPAAEPVQPIEPVQSAPVEPQEKKPEPKYGFREEDIDKVILPKKTMELMDRAAKNMKLQIRFYDGKSGKGGVVENGYIENGVIYVNQNSTRPLSFILGHEMTHNMQEQSPETYEEFKKLALQHYAEKYGTHKMEDDIKNGLEEYKIYKYKEAYDRAWKSGLTEEECEAAGKAASDAFTREKFEDEIAADEAGRLLHEEGAVEEIFRTKEEINDPSWLERLGNVKDFVMDYIQKIAQYFGYKGNNEVSIKQLQQKMGEMYRDAVMKNRGNMVQDSGKRFSIDTQAEAVGMRFEKDKDGVTHLYEDLGFGKKGREIKNIKPIHIEQSPMGAVLKQALKDGTITREQYDETLKNQAAIMQVFKNTPNLDETFAVSGAIAAHQLKEGQTTADLPENMRDNFVMDKGGHIAFQPFKSNSETQYNTTWDVTTICRKTQTAIDVMSETMKRLKRGLTPDEVIDIVYHNIYEESKDANGNAQVLVPCNVCYVFNRWVNLGTLFQTMATLRDQYPESMSVEEVQAGRVHAIEELAGNTAIRKSGKKYKRYLALLKEVEAAQKAGDEETANNKTQEAEEVYSQLQVAETGKKLAARLDDLNWKDYKYSHDTTGKAKGLTDAEKAERDEIVRVLPYFDKVTWFDYVRLQPDYKAVPDEVLFDINKSISFKRDYAGAWKYRTTRGSGMGKAAAAYAPEYFGTSIVGRAGNPKDATDLSKNLFLARNEDGSYMYIDENYNLKPEAVVLLRKAQDAAAAQNFYNGMRLQSTSDARPEYITDYNLHFIEQMCIGSKEQGFTKVPEMARLIADVGTGINFSLIAKGKGYEELTFEEYKKLDAEDQRDCVELDGKIYHALYSDVSGINHKDAMALNDAYDNAQNIMVCLSPLHGRIMCALAAKGRVTFNIPWHASGDTAAHFESKTLTVGEILNMADKVDATDYQEDKDKPNITAEEKLARNTMVAIKTGAELDKDMKSLLLKAKKDGEDSKYNILRQMYMRFRGEDIDGKPAKIQNKFLHPEDRDTAGTGYGSIDHQCRIPEWDSKTGEYLKDNKGNPVLKQVIYNKAMAELLMPNDYWDNLTTLETADRNGDIFVQFADSLGYVPRFTGYAKGKTYKENGWDLYRNGTGKGYWTTLIDTAMYDRNGNRFFETPVDASMIGESHFAPFAQRDANGHFDKERYEREGNTITVNGVEHTLTPMKENPNIDTPLMQHIIEKSVADVEARRAKDEEVFVNLVKQREQKKSKGKFPWKNVAPWIRQEWINNPEFVSKIGKQTGVKPEDIDPDDDPDGGGGGGITPSEGERRYSLGVPYQGSKNKIASQLVDLLPEGTRFVDLFSGGAAMSHAALLSGKYDGVHMNDKYPMGQQLFIDAIDGKYHDYDRKVTKDEFYNGMQYTPEGLMHSFNGNGRSYAAVDKNGRDKAAEQVKRVKELEALKPYRDMITSSEGDYSNVEVKDGDVLYADIPYEKTGNTSYSKAGKFDFKAFSEWAKNLNQPVYVSSFEAPEGFTEVWSSKEMPSFKAGSRKVEKLFVQDKFADQVKADIAARQQGSEKSERRYSIEPLEKRVSGDALLDAQDLIEEIKGVGGKVDENGIVTVYHRTKSEEAKNNILKTGRMDAKEDGLFFSTNENGSNNTGYGDHVVKLEIPVEKLQLDDIFGDEASLRLPLGRSRSLDVSQYLPKEETSGEKRYSISKTPEEFEKVKKEAIEKRGIVAANLASRTVKVTNVPIHGFTGTFREAVEQAKEWAKSNVQTDAPRTIHEGTQDEFTYTIPQNSVREFLEGRKFVDSKPREKAAYMSVLKDLDEVVDNCIETEVHPDYIDKKENGERDPDGRTADNVLIHDYWGAINVDGQPFKIKLVFKETKSPKENNPLYAYTLDEIRLSGVTSETEKTDDGLTYAPDSLISSAKLLDNIEKSYDYGKKLLDESENLTIDEGSKGTKRESLEVGSPEQEAQTHSEKFKEWFGDWEKNPEKASKVVDENGKPMIMYHFTDADDIHEFDYEHGTGKHGDVLGRRHYFTADPEDNSKRLGKNVMKVYLDIKNPYEASEPLSDEFIKEHQEQLKEILGENYEDNPYITEKLKSKRGLIDLEGYFGKDIVEALGFDGVHYGGGWLDNEQWAVKNPEQIKSATDNNGNFDKKNPDIRYSLDADYDAAVKDGNNKKASKLVEQVAKDNGFATDENGKVIDLYHGTGKFGFTEFNSNRPSGAIFTTTKSNVSANYGGNDNAYAGKRKINQGYKDDHSTEGVLRNAKSVLDQDWRLVTDADRQAIIEKVEKDAKAIMAEMDELKAKASENLPEVDGIDIFNATAWVENIIYDAALGRENGNDGDFFSEMLAKDYERYQESREEIRQYLAKAENLDKDTADYLHYLTHWKLGDVAIDAGSSFAKAFSTKEMVTVDGQSFATVPELDSWVQRTKDVGSYHLYGKLGNNPLVIDANERNWYSLDFNGMHDTDAIVEWAKKNGYTSVQFKNIYDYGDKSDVYVFFDKNQVKSADTVTYSNDGKVIPLSERFGERNDIRYSLDIPTDKIGNRMARRRGETPDEFYDRQQKYKQGIVESGEEARKRTLDQIQAYINNKQIGQMGKRDLKRLQVAVKDATPENLAHTLQQAQHTINELQQKVTDRQITRLLMFKVSDSNSRRMSIAKNVDEGTARVVKSIRSMMSDIQLTGMEDERRELNIRHAELNKEIDNLKSQISSTPAGDELDALKARLEQAQLDLAGNEEERAALKSEMETVRENNHQVTQKEVEDMLTELHEKQSKSVTDGTEWTEADEEQLIGYTIMQHRMAMNDAMAEKKVNDTRKSALELELKSKLDSNGQPKDGMEQDVERLKADIIDREKMSDQALLEANRRGQEVVSQLTELLNNGKESLQKKLDAERQRKSDIILGVWQDFGKTSQEERALVGQNERKENDEASTARKLTNLVFGSFEYLAQHMSTNRIGVDSYFYKRFVSGENGVMAAENARITNTRRSLAILNDKCKEIYGKGYLKVMKENEKVVDHTGITLTKPLKGIDVDVEIPMSKGQATYLYMVWKMPDGRIKMEHQGFDEISMEQIKEFIGEQNMAWADWVQSEYLSNLRERYNETYRSLYNTSMAEIPDYVPLKVWMDDRHEDVDVAQINAPDTLNKKEGSLMNRTFNLNGIDYTNSAYSVIAEHVQNMEEWNAYARVRQDLNYVLSSTAIKNQLNENEAGLYKRLMDACQIATRTYKPDTAIASQCVNWLTKGLVGANIAFRNTTALKQTLSLPAFLGYTQDPIYLGMLLANTFGQYLRNSPAILGTMLSAGELGRRAFKSATDREVSGKLGLALSGSLRWCIENIPSFRDRVAKGSSGNIVFDALLSPDQNTLHKKVLQLVGQDGMAANAMIDAVTCAIGMKTIHDYKLMILRDEANKLFKNGEIDGDQYQKMIEDAHRQALAEAEIYVNGTQQSNHPAFLAPVQMNSDIASKMFTLYKNSPISYARKAALSAQQLWKMRHYTQLKNEKIKDYVAQGFTEEQAEDKAGRYMANTVLKNVVGMAIYGYLMNYLWNWGGQGVTGFLQGDDDTEEDEHATKKIAEYGSPVFNGVPFVDIVMNTALEQEMNPLLLFDLQNNIATDLKKNGILSKEVGYDVLNSMSRVGFGFDLNTSTQMYLAAEHLVKTGVGADNRAKLLDYMLFMNTPNSNRKKVARKVYMDDDIDTFVENIMRADKLCDDDSWHKYLPGVRVIKEEEKQKMLKEYAEAHATEFQKKMRDENKANSVAQLMKDYTDRQQLLDAYNREKDPARKVNLGKAYIKMLEKGDKAGTAIQQQYREVFEEMFPTESDKDKNISEKEFVKTATMDDLVSIHAIQQALTQYKDIDSHMNALKARGEGDELEKYVNAHLTDIEQMNRIKRVLSRISTCKGHLPKCKTKADYDANLKAIHDNIQTGLELVRAN